MDSITLPRRWPLRPFLVSLWVVVGVVAASACTASTDVVAEQPAPATSVTATPEPATPEPAPATPEPTPPPPRATTVPVVATTELLLAATLQPDDAPAGFEFDHSALTRPPCVDGWVAYSGPDVSRIGVLVHLDVDADSVAAAEERFFACHLGLDIDADRAFRYQHGAAVAVISTGSSDPGQDVLEDLADAAVDRIAEQLQAGLPDIAAVDARNEAILGLTDMPANVTMVQSGLVNDDLGCTDPYVLHVNEGSAVGLFTIHEHPTEAFFVQQLALRPSVTTTADAADVYDQRCLYPEEGTLRRTSEVLLGTTLVVRNVEPSQDDSPSITVYRFDDGVVTVAFGFDDDYRETVSGDLEAAMVQVVNLAAERLPG